MHRAVARVLWVPLALAALAACSPYTVVRDILKEEPVPHWIYLHPHPQVGDYALYRSPDQERTPYRWRVEDVAPGRVTVSFAWVGSEWETLDELVQLYVLDEQGYVREAWLEERGQGVRHPRRIDRPGPVAAYRNFRLEPLKAPERIATPAGRFAASQVLLFEYHTEDAFLGGAVDITTVVYIDPQSKFGVVKTMQDVSTNLPINALFDFIAFSVNPVGGSTTGTPLFDYIVSLRGDPREHKFFQHFEVVETN